MAIVADMVSALQTIAPLSLAAEWDNVGLLLGDSSARVTRAMTCLTVTPDSVAEAIQANAQIIISHHPILFRPTKALTTATAEGRMILDLVRAGIAVYSPHTAFDNCAGGINDHLCEILGVGEVAPLRRGQGARNVKIGVFVPEKDLGQVSDAMFAAGAGQIGQYRECSFRIAGTGTFFGSEGTNPTIGEKGRREDVAEWRLEVVCPEQTVDRVVAAMRAAHPYEEPAYDVYTLRQAPSATGEGRLGTFATPITLAAFGDLAKQALHAATVQYVGNPQQLVNRVAIACGAAGEFLADAVRAKADVLLAGEVRFHDCLSAQAQKIALLLPGHHATERIGVEMLARKLQQQFTDLEIWASRQERDPLVAV